MMSFCCCSGYCHICSVFIDTILMIHADYSHCFIIGCYSYMILFFYYWYRTEVCFQLHISCNLECILCFFAYFLICIRVYPVYKFIGFWCRSCFHCNTCIFFVLSLCRCYGNASHCFIIHFSCQCVLFSRFFIFFKDSDQIYILFDHKCILRVCT